MPRLATGSVDEFEFIVSVINFLYTDDDKPTRMSCKRRCKPNNLPLFCSRSYLPGNRFFSGSLVSFSIVRAASRKCNFSLRTAEVSYLSSDSPTRLIAFICTFFLYVLNIYC